jgi:hypothetical protein
MSRPRHGVRVGKPPSGLAASRSRQMVSRLMDGLCVCCARPFFGGMWCPDCERHVGKRWTLRQRSYEVVTGRPCPFQV